MRTLRNIFRRKLRAFLTIFGISIGVFALVVMGSHRREAHAARRRRHEVLRGQGRHRPEGEGSASARRHAVHRQAARHRAHPRRRGAVSAEVSALLSTETDHGELRPAAIHRRRPTARATGYETFKITVRGGPRARGPTEIGKVVVGADLVTKLNANVGGRRDPRQALRGRRHHGQDAHRARQHGHDDDGGRAADRRRRPARGRQRTSVNPATIVSNFAVYLEPGVAPVTRRRARSSASSTASTRTPRPTSRRRSRSRCRSSRRSSTRSARSRCWSAACRSSTR